MRAAVFMLVLFVALIDFAEARDNRLHLDQFLEDLEGEKSRLDPNTPNIGVILLGAHCLTGQLIACDHILAVPNLSPESYANARALRLLSEQLQQCRKGYIAGCNHALDIHASLRVDPGLQESIIITRDQLIARRKQFESDWYSCRPNTLDLTSCDAALAYPNLTPQDRSSLQEWRVVAEARARAKILAQQEEGGPALKRGPVVVREGTQKSSDRNPEKQERQLLPSWPSFPTIRPLLILTASVALILLGLLLLFAKPRQHLRTACPSEKRSTVAPSLLPQSLLSLSQSVASSLFRRVWTMAKYDPAIIQQFAGALYRMAARIVAIYTTIGVSIGVLIGYYFGSTLRDGAPIAPIIGACLIGFIAYLYGQQKAFVLRLQAQTALCQAQIEANTRSRLN